MSDPIQKPLPQGFILNECQIIRVLGAGAFGITYLAHDKHLDREVAIKEYFPKAFSVRNSDYSVMPQRGADPELFKWGLDRFFLEGRTLAKFKHVSIVGIVRIFQKMGTAYLIMDYEPGLSLKKHIKQRKKNLFLGSSDFSKDELYKIVRYLSGGLKAIHKTGIIHRDIKPDNIIIRDNGVPVLLDFGAARQALLEKNTQLTVLATPAYAPPEQFLQKGEQGPWTDIFAMGAVLYQMVSGVNPYDAGTRLRAISNHQPDPLKLAKEVGRGKYPEEFLNAIDQALLIDQTKRPQTIDAWLKVMRTPQRSISSHDAETVLSIPKSLDKETQGGASASIKKAEPPANCRKSLGIATALFLLLQPIILMGYEHFRPLMAVEEPNGPDKPAGFFPEVFQQTSSLVERVLAPSTSASEFSLTIRTIPADAEIKILNIQPPYQPGIKLPPENYHLEVSRAGYETKRKWIKIKNRDRVLEIQLKKRP
ncbi:MAG: serine/threonine protein kinase [Magnetococcales bacterium]|nr:serine/threonine protein kinase [Magnetococcales bacterium]